MQDIGNRRNWGEGGAGGRAKLLEKVEKRQWLPFCRLDNQIFLNLTPKYLKFKSLSKQGIKSQIKVESEVKEIEVI